MQTQTCAYTQDIIHFFYYQLEVGDWKIRWQTKQVLHWLGKNICKMESWKCVKRIKCQAVRNNGGVLIYLKAAALLHILALLTHKLWNFMVRFCVSYISVKCPENLKEVPKRTLSITLFLQQNSMCFLSFMNCSYIRKSGCFLLLNIFFL